MKVNLKVFGIALIIILVISMACSSATPTAAPTVAPPMVVLVQPTYTPYPTYTPLPTPVPPTAVPPTKVPTKPAPTAIPAYSSGAVELSCGNTSLPHGVSAMRCFSIITNQAVGVVYYNGNGKVMGMGTTFSVGAPSGTTERAAAFIIEQAMDAGWNTTDVYSCTMALGNSDPDTNVTFGTITGRWSTDGTYISIVYMPSGNSSM